VKYPWIDGLRDTYPLTVLCRVLSVSTSGFSDWKSCGGPTQWLPDEQLLALIRSIHAEVKGSYGSPRMVEELRARGFPVSKGRGRRLMQAQGIRARHRRRYKATTNSKHRLPLAENGWFVSSGRSHRIRSGRLTSVYPDGRRLAVSGCRHGLV
jgi:putative transposase